jgi:hypothetical protein
LLIRSSAQPNRAATAVSRAEIATLPTISGRISDDADDPQSNGNSFAGQTIA